MTRFNDDIRCYGFVVGGDYDADGNYYYAEVVPSGSTGGRLWWRQFLPNVGRWWFEVMSVQVKPASFPDGVKIRDCNHAYDEGGSGGAYTLRGCVVKAMETIDDLANSDDIEQATP